MSISITSTAIQVILTYLALDGFLSLLTLAVGYYVWKKRRWVIRATLRSWLSVPGPCYHSCSVTPSDFDDNGRYTGHDEQPEAEESEEEECGSECDDNDDLDEDDNEEGTVQ